MLLLSQDIADKTQVLFIGHIILHNDNKKISIELKEGIFMADNKNIKQKTKKNGDVQVKPDAATRENHKNSRRVEKGERARTSQIIVATVKKIYYLMGD